MALDFTFSLLSQPEMKPKEPITFREYAPDLKMLQRENLEVQGHLPCRSFNAGDVLRRLPCAVTP